MYAPLRYYFLIPLKGGNTFFEFLNFAEQCVEHLRLVALLYDRKRRYIPLLNERLSAHKFDHSRYSSRRQKQFGNLERSAERYVRFLRVVGENYNALRDVVLRYDFDGNVVAVVKNGRRREKRQPLFVKI